MDPVLKDLIRDAQETACSKEDLQDDPVQCQETLEKLIKDTLKSNGCTKTLGGEAYKVCFGKECSGCSVLKLNVPKEEILLLRKIQEIVKDHEIFQHLVIRYIDSMPYIPKSYKPEKETFICVTELVTGPTLWNTRSSLSHDDYVCILALVFLTLHYLEQRGSILHMDLKGPNIVLQPWPFGSEIRIPIKSKSSGKSEFIVIPKMKYVPVVIDFGNANDGKIFTTNVYSDPEFPWQDHCYFPGFDIARLLLEARESTSFDFFKEMGLSVSRGDYDDEYMMLTARGCTKFKKSLPKYSSVFLYRPFAYLRQ